MKLVFSPNDPANPIETLNQELRKLGVANEAIFFDPWGNRITIDFDIESSMTFEALLDMVSDIEAFDDVEVRLDGLASRKGWKKCVPQTDEGWVFGWNREAIKVDEALKYAEDAGRFDPALKHEATDIILCHIDTGIATHKRINSYPGFRFEKYKSFVDEKVHKRMWKGRRHATNTAFSIIGTPDETDGVLREGDYKRKTFYKDLGAGLFPYIKEFIPIQACDKIILDFGRKAPKDVYESVAYALENNAHIISMSQGGFGDNEWYDKAAQLAYDNGILFLCAAGSFFDDKFGGSVMQPARQKLTIGCAGIKVVQKEGETQYIPLPNGRDGENEVDISAPAMFVYTADWDKKKPDIYRVGIGTSQSTAHTASMAALWRHYWKDEIASMEFFNKKSNIVDAFRAALAHCAHVPEYWTEEDVVNNVGILDAKKLLEFDLVGFAEGGVV